MVAITQSDCIALMLAVVERGDVLARMRLNRLCFILLRVKQDSKEANVELEMIATVCTCELLSLRTKLDCAMKSF